MAYTKTVWVDEILSGDERFDISQDDGTPIYSTARIELSTAVVTAGTTVTAAIMNNIEDAVDAIDAALPAGAIVGISDTQTLTNKRITQRVGSATSSATPTINTDNFDAYKLTAQAEAITSFTTNLSGTPTDFQKLTIRIKDNGTARAITWGASFEARGAALPTTTVISKVLTVGFIYDTVSAKWGCVASAQEA